jgi:hypothetical protein
MILRDLWFGADFKVKDSEQRYCLLNYRNNECVAVKITYDTAIVTGNAVVSFPFDTEVTYIPRSGETND